MSGANSGVGQGEAQVYNMNRSLNSFDQLLQSQALSRAKEQKAIQDQLKTLNTEGLREPDRDGYYKKYEEWQKASADFRMEKNSRAKYEKQAIAERNFEALKQHVARSKEAGKNDADFANRTLDDRFRDQFKDDALIQFQGNFKKSIDDPTYIADKSTLARQVNEDDINKKINQLNETLLKKSTWGNPVEVKHTQGNRAGVLAYNKREVAQEEQEKAYMNLYMIDRDMKKFIADKYPDVDPQTAIKDYARVMRETGVLSEGSAPQFKENDNWKEKALFADGLAQNREARAEARKGKTAGEEETTQRQLMVNGLINSDQEIENRIQGLVNANPEFAKGKMKIQRPKDPNKRHLVTYIIPGKMGVTAEMDADGNPKFKSKMTKGEYVVEIDMKQPNAGDKVNELLNYVTGSKVTNESYSGTKGNKNKSTATIVANNRRSGGTPAPAPKTNGVPKPKNNEAQKTDSVTVTLPNGQTGQIPRSKLDAFNARYYPKNAKKEDPKKEEKLMSNGKPFPTHITVVYPDGRTKKMEREAGLAFIMNKKGYSAR